MDREIPTQVDVAICWWMLGRLRAPALRRTAWVIVVASAVEMAIIAGQAARGVRSHFNDDGGGSNDDSTGIHHFTDRRPSGDRNGGPWPRLPAVNTR